MSTASKTIVGGNSKHGVGGPCSVRVNGMGAWRIGVGRQHLAVDGILSLASEVARCLRHEWWDGGVG